VLDGPGIVSLLTWPAQATSASANGWTICGFMFLLGLIILWKVHSAKSGALMRDHPG